MPFIHIKSVPPDVPRARASALRGLCAQVALKTGIAARHLTVTWETVEANGFVVGGQAPRRPVIVDVLLPDLHPPARVETLLGAVAGALADHAGIQPERVFANARYARSGMVFDQGEIVRWPADEK